MALASSPPASAAPVRQRDADACSPHEIVVAAVVDRSAADIGWLAWQGSSEAIVVVREVNSPLHPADISEFPDPPERPVAVDRERGTGPWALWCRARGIRACLIVPVFARGRIVGSMGLASNAAGGLGDDDLQRLQMVASLAIHARRYEARLAGLRGLFDEVSRTLENALALDRALRLPPTYRDIARSVGESLDVSYCQIAVRDYRDGLTMRAAGGHRPPWKPGAPSAWPLSQLTRCAEALNQRRAVVITFSRYEPDSAPERLALFSPTTRTGVILPFFAGPRTHGVLILGEERRSRCQPLSPERVAILELVASRIAHIMRMSRRLEYERLAERRRERRITSERQKLAREVHDQVGQALSGLLVQVRSAKMRGDAGLEELAVIEEAAQSAVDGARALAYGFRHLDRGVGPLEEARNFAETLLRAAHCSLSWTEQRTDVRVGNKILREVSRVVKESVTNIVRHARADTVRIRIQYPDGHIRVTVHDNGVGFSPRVMTITSEGRGLGLLGNKERLARIGGTFHVRSAKGAGTSVFVEAPVA